MRATPTTADIAWLPVALGNDLELLADHAHCEKKAAASAMMLLTRYRICPGSDICYETKKSSPRSATTVC